MARRQSDQSKMRRAAALKENLKRRKVQARAKAKTAAPQARTLGTAPKAGLENKPGPRPEAAAKAE